MGAAPGFPGGLAVSRPPKPVDPERYTAEYFLNDVAGAEFYKLYGPRIVKPLHAYALKKAGLAAGMRALDIGCGRGEMLFQLAQRQVEAVGADISLPALELARKTAPALVLRCDVKKLPFRDRSFDRIFFLGVLDHLHDWELEACFAEFRRVLKPGGLALANTCVNTQYYKYLSYGLRKRLCAALGLREPTPMRSSHDEEMHVNEHSQEALEEFFLRIGWRGEIEARPNEKLFVRELYGERLPHDFPLKPAPAWKRAFTRFVFHGPWKKFLAREFFCTVGPV